MITIGMDKSRNEMYHVFNRKYRSDQFPLCFMQSYFIEREHEHERKIKRSVREIL